MYPVFEKGVSTAPSLCSSRGADNLIYHHFPLDLTCDVSSFLMKKVPKCTTRERLLGVDVPIDKPIKEY